MKGQLPNTNDNNSSQTKTFVHRDWFHPVPLSEAELVDPGLTLEFDNSSQQFIVTATKGVAAWVWLDYPAGSVVQFEENGFWLRKGKVRRVGFTVVKGEKEWIEGVTVSSLWDLSTP